MVLTACNNKSVINVVFAKPDICSGLFGFVSVLAIGIQLINQSSPHHRHECFGFEPFARLNFNIYSAVMKLFMAFSTESNEIVGAVPTSFSGLYVMRIQHNFQNFIFGFTFAHLTFMSVPIQHVFSGVCEAFLYTFLILYSLNIRIFNFLNIESSYFYVH